MKRRSVLKRKSSLRPKVANTRKTRVRPVNRTRGGREWARAYGSPERVAFVRRLPCVVCGGGPCENAHTQNGGAGRKGDATTIIPLCPTCHRFQHQKGWRLLLATADEVRIHRWLDDRAAATEARWQSLTRGDA